MFPFSLFLARDRKRNPSHSALLFSPCTLYTVFISLEVFVSPSGQMEENVRYHVTCVFSLINCTDHYY